MDWVPRERRNRGCPRKTGWKEYNQPWQQEIKGQINAETERNGVWFVGDGWMDG